MEYKDWDPGKAPVAMARIETSPKAVFKTTPGLLKEQTVFLYMCLAGVQAAF
jgi:hypothetical protein